MKVPFGIAQIGKAFRNEVTPRNFIFRSREFEQMEMEWFCHPDEAGSGTSSGCRPASTGGPRWASTPATCAVASTTPTSWRTTPRLCADVEYRYPFSAPGYGELEGIAHRGVFDLTQHQEFTPGQAGVLRPGDATSATCRT